MRVVVYPTQDNTQDRIEQRTMNADEHKLFLEQGDPGMLPSK
jgi:hypothetical protein